MDISSPSDLKQLVQLIYGSLYEQVLIEKNTLLSQELEKCQAQLSVVAAEMEESKKASSGNISLDREKT